MRSLSVSLFGRVKNFHLPKNQPLLPLFEAVVNSIHAIEERRLNEPSFTGHITINICREKQESIPDLIEIAPIESFEILDDGIGFNEANFESFMESDSTYKAKYGGKGVGRFSWLKAFEKVEVDSVYVDNGEYVKRSFDFFLAQKGFNDTLADAPGTTQNRTSVKLVHCISPYKDQLPKKGETVAMRIIQHCLVYFVSPKCPRIDLIDIDETYNLNQLFADRIKTENNSATIHIANEAFEILHVKIEDTSVNGNNNSDQNLDAGIDIALSLGIGNGNNGTCGQIVDLGTNRIEQLLHGKITSYFLLVFDLNLDLVAYQPKGSSPGPGSWLMGWVWSK